LPKDPVPPVIRRVLSVNIVNSLTGYELRRLVRMS